MKQLFTLIILTLAFQIHAQVSFEYLNLPIDTFVNNSPDGFSEGIVTLPNNFNANYNSFNGFALSTMTDTTTPGFLNQYSAISGTGSNGTNTYAIGFLSANNSMFLNEPTTIKSLDINNTTYAALSMEQGDAFSKKFGGDTGDDPDYFLLTIHFFNNDVATEDSIEFYLADYRFEDNTMDYIVNEWTTIDLSEIENLYDEIRFTLTSTDNGAFGMNTPNYIALDNVVTSPVNTNEQELENTRVYPNPVFDLLTIEVEDTASINLFNSIGQQVFNRSINNNVTVNLESLRKGIYYLHIESQGKNNVKKIIKQ